MDVKDIELVKKIVEEAVRGATEGMVSVALVGFVVSGLVAAIGALWGWGFKLSKDFAAKIEEILKNQQGREDIKEKSQEEKINGLLGKKEERHQKDLDRLNERIDRLEKARDLARDQYNESLKEGQALLSKQLAESTASITEHNEITDDILIPLIKQFSRER